MTFVFRAVVHSTHIRGINCELWVVLDSLRLNLFCMINKTKRTGGRKCKCRDDWVDNQFY